MRGRICCISELSGSTWTKRWPDLFDGLTSDERRVVIVAVADNVLEGWQPERADIEALVDVVRGKCTTREYIERVRRDSHRPVRRLRDLCEAVLADALFGRREEAALRVDYFRGVDVWLPAMLRKALRRSSSGMLSP